MSNLSRTASKVTMVISDKYDNLDVNKLVEWFKENCKDYSFIKHDKDKNDDGSSKFIHYHCVFTLKRNKIRLSTTLNSLSKLLSITGFAIQLDRADNYGLCLQYLIHRNNPEKYQYSLSEVVSSLPLEEFTLVMSESIDIVNYDILKAVCSESLGSKMYIMERIGIGYYSKYRNVIMDILTEISQVESTFKNIK